MYQFITLFWTNQDRQSGPTFHNDLFDIVSRMIPQYSGGRYRVGWYGNIRFSSHMHLHVVHGWQTDNFIDNLGEIEFRTQQFDSIFRVYYSGIGESVICKSSVLDSIRLLAFRSYLLWAIVGNTCCFFIYVHWLVAEFDLGTMFLLLFLVVLSASNKHRRNVAPDDLICCSHNS